MLKLIRPLALAIMIAAMASSYHTQIGLFHIWQVDGFTSAIAPISIDALAVICAIALGIEGVGGKRLAAVVLIVTLSGSMTANFLAGSTLGSKIVHAAMVLIYLLAELVASRVRVEQHPAPHAPAAAPTSTGMPPVMVDTAEALAFRQAQAELRRTSSLAGLNTSAE